MLSESECDGVSRDTKSANGGDWRVRYGPSGHRSSRDSSLFPFKRCDYTATMRAHTSTHALPAVLIQFRRLEGRDKEIEGAERSRGVKGSHVRDVRKERRELPLSLSLSFVILSAPYADEELI